MCLCDLFAHARYIVASFLSPNGARGVFPCFDEPAFKANYSITLVHPAGYRALSNMPALKQEARGPGWNATRFQTTPKMSTYLVAFVVCDFVRESRTVDNTVVSALQLTSLHTMCLMHVEK